MPARGWFQPVSRSYEAHTHMLGDVLAHTAVSAQREGIGLDNVHRENTLRLEVGGEFSGLGPSYAEQQ